MGGRERSSSQGFSMLDTQGDYLEDRAEGLEVLADPMFGKVFYNLIDNSLRHRKRSAG